MGANKRGTAVAAHAIGGMSSAREMTRLAAASQLGRGPVLRDATPVAATNTAMIGHYTERDGWAIDASFAVTGAVGQERKVGAWPSRER